MAKHGDTQHYAHNPGGIPPINPHDQDREDEDGPSEEQQFLDWIDEQIASEPTEDEAWNWEMVVRLSGHLGRWS